MKDIPTIKNSTEIKKILRCAFDLTDLEVSITLMLPPEGMRVKEIQNILKKDRTTIQKSLKILVDKELIFRESKCCVQGKRGRYFVYRSLDRQEIRKRVLTNIDKWYEGLQESVKSF
ncbi:MAG TPA: helix-turn-helix domain-containing protein [Methanofastidiosum sp.]|mgnify:FL=1|nr:helix-turn-helix domain-containing protein [Methanofastidiosum sp.]